MSASHIAADRPSPAQVAEAGVWVARLHGEQRGQELEDGFRRWLAAHPGNRRAFEVATEVWEESAGLRRIVALAPIEHRMRRPRRPSVVALAAAVAALAIGIVWYVQSGVVATAVGEQRMLTLEDGTRVFLNTDTRVAVHYGEAARRVELESGEALFNVAKRKDWPFIVTAGDQQVRALGTSFVVRRDGQRLAVTLVEGKVTVSPVAEDRGRDASGTDAARSTRNIHPASELTATYALIPGDRLILAAGAQARFDRPSLENAVAWRRGQIVLDDTSLADAVTEMNRYNKRRLVIERPEAAGLVVNGLFQAGDSESFANAVAQTYGLQVIEDSAEIVLSGTPGLAAPANR